MDNGFSDDVPERFTPSERNVATALFSSGVYSFAEWSSVVDRELSSDFLLWMISDQTISHPVLCIERAIFPEDVTLRAYRSEKHFEFIDCRFHGKLDFRHIRLRQLVLNKSEFKQALRLNGAQLSRGIIANNAKFEELVLQAAELDGNLELSGSKVNRPIRAYQLQVKKVYSSETVPK